MLKKKLLLPIGTMLMTASPMIAVMSCATQEKYITGEGYDISKVKESFINDISKHKNVMSSYFNNTDMLAALGHYPDYVSLNGGGDFGKKTLYPKYLRGILGSNFIANKNVAASNNTGKYEIKTGIKIMDGKTVDREAFVKYDISTLLLNEWEQVDENKFTDIVPALIYTSMADGHARYSDEGFVKKKLSGWGLNTYEAFKMFAKGLDRGYKGRRYIEKANKIISEVKENVKKARTAINAKNKTIMVLETKINPDGTLAFFGRSPGVFNILYSSHEDRGLGFELPTPKNTHNIKYENFKYTAKDNATFIDEFEHKADEIIILNNKNKPKNQYDKINNDSGAAAQQMLKTGKTINHNIHIVDRSDFYDTVWGIIGINDYLNKITNLFGVNYQPNIIEEFKDTNKLTKLR